MSHFLQFFHIDFRHMYVNATELKICLEFNCFSHHSKYSFENIIKSVNRSKIKSSIISIGFPGQRGAAGADGLNGEVGPKGNSVNFQNLLAIIYSLKYYLNYIDF